MSEPYAKRTKRLTSAAKQLRGWVGSDPSKEPDLIDALNRLTEHRLLGHAYTDAFADAQDAFVRAYKAAPAPGTLGPLTKTESIVRQIEAMAHLAMVQVAAGQPESAAQTALAALAVRADLGRPDLDHALSPASKVWLLTAVSRGAAAAGDLARANAYADAALARAVDAGFATHPRLAPLAIDTEALVADSRWSVGVGHDALDHTRRALALQQQLTDAARRQSPPVPAAQLARLAAPACAYRRDLADRLDALGDPDAALLERRTLVARLSALPGGTSPEVRESLAWAHTDLAAHLAALGRLDEAAPAAADATAAASALTKAESRPGQFLAVQLVAGATAATVSLRRDDPEAAAEALRAPLQRHAQFGAPDAFAAAFGVALVARAEVEDALDLAEDAAATRTEFRALAARILAQTPAGDVLYGTVPAEAFVRDRARGVVTRSPLPTPHWENLSPVASFATPATAGSEEATIPTPDAVATTGPGADPAPVGPSHEPAGTQRLAPAKQPLPTDVDAEAAWTEPTEPAATPDTERTEPTAAPDAERTEPTATPDTARTEPTATPDTERTEPQEPAASPDTARTEPQEPAAAPDTARTEPTEPPTRPDLHADAAPTEDTARDDAETHPTPGSERDSALAPTPVPDEEPTMGPDAASTEPQEPAVAPDTAWPGPQEPTAAADVAWTEPTAAADVAWCEPAEAPTQTDPHADASPIEDAESAGPSPAHVGEEPGSESASPAASEPAPSGDPESRESALDPATAGTTAPERIEHAPADTAGPAASTPTPTEPTASTPTPAEPAASDTPEDVAAAARTMLASGRPEEAEAAAREVLQVYRPTLEVVALLQVIADARAAQGDRKGVPAIANQIVEQLRPLAEGDLATHGTALVSALQGLSEARKAAGDWWGSLGPGREAKQLAKRLPR